MSKRFTESDLRRLKAQGFKFIEPDKKAYDGSISNPYILDECGQSSGIFPSIDTVNEIDSHEQELKPKPKKRNKEECLQIQLAIYLRVKHPDVIFHSDVASGMKLTIGQAVKNKKMQYSRSYPDMFISEPRGKYAGLYLELKHSHEEIYKKDGSLREIEHIQEQKEMMDKLTAKGYMAVFSCGYDKSVRIIEDYLKL